MNFTLPKLPDWPAWAQIPPLSFIWHDMLWLLLAVPAFVGLYFFVLSRKRKSALRFGNFGKLLAGLGQGGGWRGNLPPILFLIGLTFTILAVARPTAVILTASTKATVILAMDVSQSMQANDMKPSRILAAQDAARAFVNDQPKDVQIGIVAFAATAFLVQNPTSDHQALNAAIDRFELQRGTAVGSGILMSLATLFPGEGILVNGPSYFTQGNTIGSGTAGGTALGADTNGAPTLKKPDPVEPGSLKTSIVILMTDGATTTGPDPVDASRQAADHGLRVFTVGFGQRAGGPPAAGGGFGGGGFGGGGFGGRRMNLDENALKQIAEVTRSKYYYAGSAEDLKKVFSTLSKQRIVKLEETEITAFFAGIAAVFTLLSAGLSMFWFNRVL